MSVGCDRSDRHSGQGGSSGRGVDRLSGIGLTTIYARLHSSGFGTIRTSSRPSGEPPGISPGLTKPLRDTDSDVSSPEHRRQQPHQRRRQECAKFRSQFLWRIIFRRDGHGAHRARPTGARQDNSTSAKLYVAPLVRQCVRRAHGPQVGARHAATGWNESHGPPVQSCHEPALGRRALRHDAPPPGRWLPRVCATARSGRRGRTTRP